MDRCNSSTDGMPHPDVQYLEMSTSDPDPQTPRSPDPRDPRPQTRDRDPRPETRDPPVGGGAGGPGVLGPLRTPDPGVLKIPVGDPPNVL